MEMGLDMYIPTGVLLEAVSHTGSCRCWRCLLWWTELAQNESFGPFTVEEKATYLADGLPFTVTNAEGEVATGVMRRNMIESADPAFGGITTLEDLEVEAKAQGWTISHAYTQVGDAWVLSASPQMEVSAGS